MAKSLKWRFILFAMFAIALLLIILIVSITVFNYINMENSSNNTLKTLLEERRPPIIESRNGPAFAGYELDNIRGLPSSYFVLIINGDSIVGGEGPLTQMVAEDEVLELATYAISSKNDSGKISSYKFLKTTTETGLTKIAFLDNSIEVRMMLNTLSISLLVGFAILIVMFIIIYLVSSRVTGPIEKNIEKQRRFISDASHELKTPLGIIQTNTEAMELHTGENRWTTNIKNQTERMDGLVKSLLLLAKNDEENEKIKMDDVNLSNLVHKEIDSFKETLTSRNLTINSEVEDDVIIKGDSSKLNEVISILLDNATKYANDNSEIILFLKKDGKRSVFTIENEASELKNINTDALFDRFYRGSTSRGQKEGGYGLGLSIASSIVKNHKGKITSEIKDNKIKFIIIL